MHIHELSKELESARTHFDNQLKGVRTGRAQPTLVEGVKVEVYGSVMELKSLASVTVSDAHTLVISPWDAANVSCIEKAINESSLGLRAQSDGKTLRIVVPAPTEETRTQMVKLMREMSEQARIVARRLRDEVKSHIIDREKKGEIGEDERFRLQGELDEQIKKYNSLIEERTKKKEAEIMSL